MNPSAIDVASELSAIAARRVGQDDCECLSVSVGTDTEVFWVTYGYRARRGVFGYRCGVEVAVASYDSRDAAELANLIWFGEIEAPPPEGLTDADGVKWWGDAAAG